MTRAAAEAFPVAQPGDDSQRQSAQRANSVTHTPVLPLALPLVSDTASDGPARVQAVVDGIADAFATVASGLTAGVHIHGHRPSMAEAREHAHEVAARYNGWAFKYGRLLYAYLWYLPLHAGLLTADALLEHPSVLLLIAGLTGLAWFFL